MEESQTLHGREEYRLYSFYLHRSHHLPIKLNVVRDDYIHKVDFSWCFSLLLFTTAHIYPCPFLSYAAAAAAFVCFICYLPHVRCRHLILTAATVASCAPHLWQPSLPRVCYSRSCHCHLSAAAVDPTLPPLVATAICCPSLRLPCVCLCPLSPSLPVESRGTF